MAYKSYLFDKYEFTHENRFFRLLDEKFRNAYENSEDDHILIGNISVGGHSLDAIFIKRGAIVVLDFKDYSGDLTFVENGPWRLVNDKGQMIFVAGGAHSRNPYQQVNAYRFALFQFLSEKSNEILLPNHLNISWDHTNGLVLFQRNVDFELNTIPPKVQRYFHISHFEKIVDDLNDIHSKKLDFSNEEIHNILKVLNVNTDFPYLANKADDIEEETRSIDPGRMDRIIQLIPKIEDENESKRALGFYNTMLSIERINNSSVSDIHHYPIIWEQAELTDYNLIIETNRDFLNVFLNNKEQRFPKNLFFSVNLSFEGITVPLFYTIIAISEIENHNNINLIFDGFELYKPILEELNLSEDVIGELLSIVNQYYTLNEKIQAVKEFLDISLELIDKISVGLSNESLFTSQLQSELNQWIKNRRPLEKNLVFEGMLTNSKVPTEIEKNSDYLIQITNLNKSQKESIELSFTQPLTVITGPPGTGKSQVVTNILANAVVSGQKVLFASKNNKAVDNVHTRISNLLSTNYFLRLGSNRHNNDLVDKLNVIIQQIRNKTFPDSKELLKSKKVELEHLIDEKRRVISQLESINILESIIPELEASLQTKKSELDTWAASIKKEEYNFYIVKNLEYNISQTEINELQRTIKDSKNGFINKTLFNWFKKSDVINSIKRLNNKLPPELKIYVDTNAPVIAKKGDLIEGVYLNLKFIDTQKSIQQKLKYDYSEYITAIATLEQDIKEKSNTLNSLKANKENLQLQVDKILLQEPSIGIEILELTINEKLRNADINIIENYKSLISNGIPWRSEEQRECSNVTNAFLEIFNTISITSLTIKKGFVLEPGIFDLLVIDEASQCDVTSALPLIYRAKKVVIIGDSLQLPHITSIKKHEQQFVLEKLNLSRTKYNYIENSLFEKAKSVANLSLLESSFLNEHYRCHPQIIDFSNHHFYLAKAGHSLDIKTNAHDFVLGKPGFNWENVIGRMEDGRNVNKAEIQKCVTLAKSLSQDYPNASIGIATPFKHQKEELNKAIKDLNLGENVTCDVIHNFQGDEKDIIILSLVVTTNCKSSLPRFINEYSPYLLNVAVTRAKSALYVVGNKQYCNLLTIGNGQKSLLANLANYDEILKN